MRTHSRISASNAALENASVEIMVVLGKSARPQRLGQASRRVAARRTPTLLMLADPTRQSRPFKARGFARRNQGRRGRAAACAGARKTARRQRRRSAAPRVERLDRLGEAALER